MFKNVATKIELFAFDITTGAAKTGDAANLTASVSKDFGTVTDLTDTSATEMDATKAPGWYLFDVSQTESNADHLLFTGRSSTANVSVVGRPVDTTPNRFTSMVIDAAGLVDANTVKVGPSGSGTAQTAGDIIGDTNDIQARLPAALVGGRMDSSVGAMAADTVTASAIATDAIGALELAAGAASEIATAVRTELTTELGRIDVAISTRASQTSVDTIDDFVDTEVAAIKAVTDKLDTMLAQTSDGYHFNANAVDEIPFAVWSWAQRTLTAFDEDDLTLDIDATIRAAMGLAAANLDTQLSTIDDYIDTEVAAIKTTTDKLDQTLVNSSDGYIFTAAALQDAPTGGGGTPPTAAEIADAVWDEGTAGHVGAGSFGKLVQDTDATATAIKAKTDALPSDPADASDIASSFATVNSKLDAIDDFVDTEVAAIKAKTDNLPSDPADASDIAAAFSSLSSQVTTVDSVVDAIKATTDKVDTMLQLADTDGNWQFTVAALMMAPTLTADDVWDEVIEAGYTARESMRVQNSWAAGKSSGFETLTPKFRNLSDTKDVIDGELDEFGNRLTSTIDAT